ncbi:MAG: dihydroorotate dehydrogenase [Planctomycetes bacterium]|nr:dihydroorotate dehydrogenase [Planctomycetota bacterium]
MDLTVRLGRLTLPNPVMTASGTYGKGLEFRPFYDVSRLGAVVVKTITSEPRAGNPPPRLVETAGGLLNSIGLENPGIDEYVRTYLPLLRTLRAPLVINIAGHSPEDFAALAARLDPEPGIAALELNMSCPNVAHGLDYSTSPDAARHVVALVRSKTGLPLIAKLSPNVTDVRPVAKAAVEAGADAVSVINTLLGMAVDWRRRAPVLGRGVGGLSGPCIKPVALRIVKDVSRAVDAPVIGIGGIQNADDAMEFFVAGAAAIQVGTANYYLPTAAVDILDGLPSRFAVLGATRMADVVGTLKDPVLKA